MATIVEAKLRVTVIFSFKKKRQRKPSVVVVSPSSLHGWISLTVTLTAQLLELKNQHHNNNIISNKMATERGTAPEGTEEEVVNQHYIIADNLRHKAFYEDAIDEYQRALCAQEPELGAESPAVGYTHYGLGLSFRALKEYKQAMVHLKAAATIFEGAVQKLKASETNGSGTANSKVDGQIDTLYQAMKKCKISLARAYHSNGVDLQRNGQYDKSILEHRKAVAIRENILGRSHLETARSYYVMGCALSDRGDFDEALSELRRSLRSRLLVFGKDHMDVKEVVMNIGTVLYARGGRMSADQIVEYKMLIIDSVKHENEGDTYMRKQQYEDAMASYRTAIALEQQCLGDLHPTTTDLYLRMAVSLMIDTVSYHLFSCFLCSVKMYSCEKIPS